MQQGSRHSIFLFFLRAGSHFETVSLDIDNPEKATSLDVDTEGSRDVDTFLLTDGTFCFRNGIVV